MQINPPDPLYPDRVECDVVEDTLVELAANTRSAERSVISRAGDDVVDSRSSTTQAKVLSDGDVLVAAHETAMEAILNELVDAVIVFDAAARVQWMNAAGRMLLQVKATDAPYTATDVLACLQLRDVRRQPVDAEHWSLTRALRSGESARDIDPRDVLQCTGPGETRFVSVSATPLRGDDGSITGAVLVVRDVTGYHRFQEQRAQALRSVAHDLGNPLGSVSLYVQTQLRQLQQGRLPYKPDLTLLRTMEHALERADRLVKDLQALARLDGDQADYRFGRCELRSLCRRELDLWRQLTDRAFVFVASGQLLDVMIDGDRICQALANLLSNAHKYSPADQPIRVTVRRTHDGKHVRLAVQDAGPGIPKHERQAIWEPFHRAAGIEIQSAPATAPEMGGNMGLGLAITKAVVERHRGTVGVTSSPGKGSTFYFILPLASPTSAMHAQEDRATFV